MFKIRRSADRLIFNMGIPLPGKDGLYIEIRPSFPVSIPSSCLRCPSWGQPALPCRPSAGAPGLGSQHAEWGITWEDGLVSSATCYTHIITSSGHDLSDTFYKFLCTIDKHNQLCAKMYKVVLFMCMGTNITEDWTCLNFPGLCIQYYFIDLPWPWELDKKDMIHRSVTKDMWASFVW